MVMVTMMKCGCKTGGLRQVGTLTDTVVCAAVVGAGVECGGGLCWPTLRLMLPIGALLLGRQSHW